MAMTDPRPYDAYGINISARRSWKLHSRLATHLSPETFEQWRPTIERNLERNRAGTPWRSELRDLDRWQQLVADGDLPELRRIMTGLDPDSVEMRDVSPMSGLLSPQERLEVLGVPPELIEQTLERQAEFLARDTVDVFTRHLNAERYPDALQLLMRLHEIGDDDMVADLLDLARTKGVHEVRINRWLQNL